MSENIKVPGASDYYPIDSIMMLRLYFREDMNCLGGNKFINPFRWLMGEERSRMKLYIYVLRILEYVINKRNCA